MTELTSPPPPAAAVPLSLRRRGKSDFHKSSTDRKAKSRLASPDFSSESLSQSGGTAAGGDGEVKCGDSRIDVFGATFKFAHL